VNDEGRGSWDDRMLVLPYSDDSQTQCATAVLTIERGLGQWAGSPTSFDHYVRLEKVSFKPGSDFGFKLVYPSDPPPRHPK
jgi:hypothetical protein